MKNKVDVLRIILSLFISTVWVVVAPLSMVFLVSGLSFAQKNNLKGWLLESGVYEKSVEVGVNSLFFRIKNEADKAVNDEQVNIEKLDKVQSNAVQTIGSVFSADWIKGEVERNIDILYDYVNGGSNKLFLTVNFNGKEALARESIAGLFKSMASSLPKCENGIVGEYYDFDLFSASCLPRNMNLGEMYGIIDNGVAKLAPMSSDGVGGVKIDTGEKLLQIKNGVRTLKYVTGLVVGVLTLLFLVIWWLVPKFSWKMMFGGVVLFVCGVLTTLLGFGFRFSYKDYLEANVFLNVNQADAGLVGLAMEVVEVVLLSLSNKVMFLGLVFVLLGIFVLWARGDKKTIEYAKSIQMATYCVASVSALFIVWSVAALMVQGKIF